MKVSYKISTSGTLTISEQTASLIEHEADVDFESAVYLLNQLRSDDSNLWVETPTNSLDFYIGENSLWVEIYGRGFWSVAEIDMATGAEILKVVYEGGSFGELIPGTNREWYSYASWK